MIGKKCEELFSSQSLFRRFLCVRFRGLSEVFQGEFFPLSSSLAVDCHQLQARRVAAGLTGGTSEAIEREEEMEGERRGIRSLCKNPPPLCVSSTSLACFRRARRRQLLCFSCSAFDRDGTLRCALAHAVSAWEAYGRRTRGRTRYDWRQQIELLFFFRRPLSSLDLLRQRPSFFHRKRRKPSPSPLPPPSHPLHSFAHSSDVVMPRAKSQPAAKPKTGDHPPNEPEPNKPLSLRELVAAKDREAEARKAAAATAAGVPAAPDPAAASSAQPLRDVAVALAPAATAQATAAALARPRRAAAPKVIKDDDDYDGDGDGGDEEDPGPAAPSSKVSKAIASSSSAARVSFVELLFSLRRKYRKMETKLTKKTHNKNSKKKKKKKQPPSPSDAELVSRMLQVLNDFHRDRVPDYVDQKVLPMKMPEGFPWKKVAEAFGGKTSQYCFQAFYRLRPGRKGKYDTEEDDIIYLEVAKGKSFADIWSEKLPERDPESIRSRYVGV